MTPEPTRVRLLASVTNEAEARLAAVLGADVIDAKNPAEGALGALQHAVVIRIVDAVGGRVPVSATIGDLPFEAVPVASAAETMAATGVDYVKIGVFPARDAMATIERLGGLQLGACRLVAVLLADRVPDFTLVPALARAGFAGVMLDTADKESGALTDVITKQLLRAFIALARGEGLFAGLAGALRHHHIPELLDLEPDILGFRGALCEGALRTGMIDPKAISKIRAAISAATAEARAS